MNKHKMRTAAGVAALALLAGCSTSDTATIDDTSTQTATTDGATTTTDADTIAGTSAENEAPHEIDPYDYDASEVQQITLGFDSVSAASAAVSVDGTTATITSAGVYEITGTLTDGSIIVDAGDEAVVRLILSNADITNTRGAAIAVMSADTAVVILTDGTSNALTDGEVYDLPADEDEPNAALFSKADLTLAGTGSLTVVGKANDGIASKDGLVILGGNIDVTAVDDGVRGKDYVVIDGGELTVEAGGDGIKSDDDEDAGRGYITLNEGVADVTAGDDGLQAAMTLTINGGDLTVASIDDAIKADFFVTINDGDIEVTTSYEGIESEVITINGGNIDVTSNDDGLNVATSEDSTTTTAAAGAGGPGGARGGGGGGGPADENVGEFYIYINGGTTTITVTAELDEQGDGIDANGHVVMTGGFVSVSGPTDTRNSAIDYSGGSFEVTGGTFIGTNINGRNSEGVEAGSAQASLYVTLGSVAQAGTVIQIQATSGDDLVTFTPANQYDVVVFTSPDLVAGESYEIHLDGTSVGTVTAS